MTGMLVKEFDTVFNELFNTRNTYPGGVAYQTSKTDNEYILEVPLVGMTKDDVKVTVEKEVLKVTAKKNASRFSRDYNNSWLLLDDHNTDDVRATMENGILTVKIGRKKPERRVIDVTVV